MNKIEEAITEHWGACCAEYVEGCPICDAWAEYAAMKLHITRLQEIIQLHKQWRVKAEIECQQLQSVMDNIRDLLEKG